MSKSMIAVRRRRDVISSLAALIMTTGALAASGAEPPSSAAEFPTLELVLTVRASIEAPLAMGKTPQGERRVIPISGGTFEGSGLKGTILPGGEDWQLVRDDGVTQLDARYWMREQDGTIIRVHNKVLINPPQQGAADAQRYVRSIVEFEAPVGKHDWLNKAVFIGTLTADTMQRPPVVTLRFFRVN